MIENKKEQQRKDNDQNDFRAMLDKPAKINNNKGKNKKQEFGISPDDIVKSRQQLQTVEEQ